jgi:hypothetical protein
MLSQLQQFVNSINKPKYYLLLANVLLVFFLILLGNLKVIPLDASDFVFFALLVFMLAIYRPSWAFLIFVGLVPLENINLAPTELGMAVRPYQFLGALLIVALLLRFFTKRLNFKLIKLKLPDYLVIVMTLAGFLSVAAAPDKFVSLKLAVIFATFAALYFLVRNFIQNTDDLKKIIPFFLSSSVVVIFYGIWQNWAYLHNLNNFEVMPGRPNGTFTEADWLGMFLVIVISMFFVLIRDRDAISSAGDSIYLGGTDAQILNFRLEIFNEFSMTKFLNYILLVISFILLILTVSRSAWLAALFTMLMLLFIIWTDLRFNVWRWKESIYSGLKILASLVVAVGLIYIFNLTDFQLGNRIQSTGTGLQQITIACAQKINLPEKIATDSELTPYACRQINLQDIAANQNEGKYVTSIYRNDPNVATRNEIYQKSLAQIKNNPALGIGWGSISQILGTDARGVPLNSSNIFLETWLGAGLVGFLALVILLGYILFTAVKNYFYASDDLQKTTNLFVIISWFGLVITNLFNAGIFLGFFWVWLAVTIQSGQSVPKL